MSLRVLPKLLLGIALMAERASAASFANFALANHEGCFDHVRKMPPAVPRVPVVAPLPEGDVKKPKSMLRGAKQIRSAQEAVISILDPKESGSQVNPAIDGTSDDDDFGVSNYGSIDV